TSEDAPVNWLPCSAHDKLNKGTGFCWQTFTMRIQHVHCPAFHRPFWQQMHQLAGFKLPPNRIPWNTAGTQISLYCINRKSYLVGPYMSMWRKSLCFAFLV